MHIHRTIIIQKYFTMRFTISSTQLSSCLNNLSKVIVNKNSLPILNSFLFEINDGHLTVTASDNENVMKAQLELEEFDYDGEFCLSSRTILDAVKELAEQPITIDVDLSSMQTKIIYLNGIYKIVAQSAQEFPRVISLQEQQTTFTMNSSALHGCVSRSLFATASDELRPVMNGIYFDLKPECLCVVSSDGHKLVRNTVFSVKSETPAAFVLPKKPASLLKNVLRKDDSEIIIKFDNRNAEFIYPEGTLTCRLTEGRYPNYNSVIPLDNSNVIVVDRRSLLGSLKRILPFASDSSQLVRLHIENGKLEISSEDIDFSTSAREEMICSYDGYPMNIGFKGTTLTEVLNNLDSEEVVVKLADPARAGVIVPAQNSEEEEVLMLMMPMLLND